MDSSSTVRSTSQPGCVMQLTAAFLYHIYTVQEPHNNSGGTPLIVIFTLRPARTLADNDGCAPFPEMAGQPCTSFF